jgi:DNA-directed RNA polymerase specialized sigma24 family protein
MGDIGVAGSAFGPADSSVMRARARQPKRGERNALAADAAIRLVLERLYQDHYVALVRLAALLSGDPLTGEEIAADSLIAVAAHATVKRGPQDELFSLRQQVVLRCRLAPPRSRTAARTTQPAVTEVALPGQTEPGAGGWGSARIVQELRSLPIRQREVVVLTHYLGLSEADVVRLTGSSQRAVDAVLAGVCRALAEALHDSGDEQPGTPES